jgi:hypothetical protein
LISVDRAVSAAAPGQPLPHPTVQGSASSSVQGS